MCTDFNVKILSHFISHFEVKLWVNHWDSNWVGFVYTVFLWLNQRCMYAARLPFCGTLNDRGCGRSVFANHYFKTRQDETKQDKKKKNKKTRQSKTRQNKTKLTLWLNKTQHKKKKKRKATAQMKHCWPLFTLLHLVHFFQRNNS